MPQRPLPVPKSARYRLEPDSAGAAGSLTTAEGDFHESSPTFGEALTLDLTQPLSAAQLAQSAKPVSPERLRLNCPPR